MALVKCPVCGKQVSTLADSCPNCGEPLHESVNTISTSTARKAPVSVNKTQSKSSFRWIAICMAVVLVVGGVAFALNNDTENVNYEDVVGVWYAVYRYNSNNILELKNDGTYASSLVSGIDGKRLTFSGKYSIKGNTITCHPSVRGNATNRYTFVDGILYLSGKEDMPLIRK